MKSTILLLAFSAFVLVGNAQRIIFNNQLDTSYYKGSVQSLFVYKYSIPFSSHLTTNKNLSDDLIPKQSYHYDDQKQLIKIVYYKEDSTLSVTQFLYDENGRLKYEVRGKIDNNSLNITGDESLFQVKDNTSFNLTLTYFIDHNIILKTGGSEIIHYHYHSADSSLLITSSTGEPSTKCFYDKKGHIIEVEDYSFEKGQLKLRKEFNDYDKGLLVVKKRHFENKEVVDSNFYDEQGKVIIQKTVSSDSSLCRTRYNEYSINGGSISRVYDVADKLILIVEKDDNEDESSSKIFKVTSDGKSIQILETIEFNDNIGNIIKRYDIDFTNKTATVSEFHFNYH